ncbi:MAG: L-arabinose ABC transporter permease AraH [Candidatus Sumerlaeota bacterium]|nr:L-arabinose ABC transporter permease AraH [Candidatus Sumerlaeota bacterium]
MSEAPTANSQSRIQFSAIWDKTGMLVVLLILFILCSCTVSNFLSFGNMVNIGLAVSTIGIISCTMLFCLASGDFDLSIGSVVACSGVVAAAVMNKVAGSSGPLAGIIAGIFAGLAMGALVGLVNGLVIAKLKINALITTLATMMIVRGLAFIFADGKSVGVKVESFSIIGNSTTKINFTWLASLFRTVSESEKVVLTIPSPVYVTVICFIVFGFLLRSTIFGRNTLAVGGNKEAARLAGIAVDRLKIIIFLLQGIMSAVAGIILASRMSLGDPKVAQGLELQVISACVLGGVSLTGGVGSMLFVISGVLIMGMVENAMNLLNMDPFYQYLVRGMILLAAVIFDRFKQTRTT